MAGKALVKPMFILVQLTLMYRLGSDYITENMECECRYGNGKYNETCNLLSIGLGSFVQCFDRTSEEYDPAVLDRKCIGEGGE